MSFLKLQGASTDAFNPDFKLASKKKAFYDARVSHSCQSIRQNYLLQKIEAYRHAMNQDAITAKLESAYVKKVHAELTYLRQVVTGTTDPRMMSDAFVKFFKNIKSDLPKDVQSFWNDQAGDALLYAIRLRFNNDPEARDELLRVLPYPMTGCTLVLPAKTPSKPDDFVLGAEEDENDADGKPVFKGNNFYGKALTKYVKMDLTGALEKIAYVDHTDDTC